LRADPATKQPDQYARPSIWARLAELFRRIRYKPGAGRDIHLDFLRGWCIFSMVVDHAAGERPSLLFGVTGNGPWPLTGAHGFVTLSGMVMGLLYVNVVAREGDRMALRKLASRAFKIYLVAIALGFFDIAWGFMPILGSGTASITWDGILGIVTLTKGADDLMTFYVTLIVLAAPAILLLRRGYWWVVLGASLGAWVVHQINESWLNPPTVYFVPVADWQLLFIAGLLIGWHRKRLREMLAGRRGVMFNVALLSLFAAFLLIQVFVVFGRVEAPDWLNMFAADAWQGYDHNPPAHMLALFTYMLSFHRLTSWVWLPLSRLLGWFLIPLGQSALYVYTVHTVLVFYVLQSLDRFQGLQGLPLTIALLALMLLLWVLVKRRFLFWLIPR
jgi:hypothetical protein